MASAWGDTLAVVALVAALVAAIIAWIALSRYRSAHDLILVLRQENREQADRVERLGGTVTALRATIETKVQKIQISALERQVEMATAALKRQDDPFEAPRTHPKPTGLGASTNASATPDGADAQNSSGTLVKVREWVDQRRQSFSQSMGRRPRRGPNL
ncbi:MAG TPA: hypothetical protein VGX00_00345 [Thermoplasmata archaeon]|nr:hypothetical protein [Thermoplasmata archaeon]